MDGECSAFLHRLAMRHGNWVHFAALTRRDSSIAAHVEEALEKVDREARAAYVEASDLINKMMSLQRRCSLVDPRAVYWGELS